MTKVELSGLLSYPNLLFQMASEASELETTQMRKQMSVHKLRIYADQIFGYTYMFMEIIGSKLSRKLLRTLKELYDQRTRQPDLQKLLFSYP